MTERPRFSIFGRKDAATEKVQFKGLDPSIATADDCRKALEIIYACSKLHIQGIYSPDDIIVEGSGAGHVTIRLQSSLPGAGPNYKPKKEDEVWNAFHDGAFIGALSAHIPVSEQNMGYMGHFSTSTEWLAKAINATAQHMLDTTTYEHHLKHVQKLHEISALQDGRTAQRA